MRGDGTHRAAHLCAPPGAQSRMEPARMVPRTRRRRPNIHGQRDKSQRRRSRSELICHNVPGGNRVWRWRKPPAAEIIVQRSGRRNITPPPCTTRSCQMCAKAVYWLMILTLSLITRLASSKVQYGIICRWPARTLRRIMQIRS